MKRTLTSIALGVVAAVAFATPALAAPVASFTADSPPTVGQPVTFTADGGTDCVVNRCDWSVTWTNQSTHRTNTIANLGTGAVRTWTPTALDATRPYVVVALKVTTGGGTNNFTLAQRAYVVAVTS